MKAAVFLGKNQIQVTEVQKRSVGAGEVEIRVDACGICGTDQHIYHGKPGSASVNPPIILGHELSGTVTDVGEGVHGFELGARVSIDPNIYCGVCVPCRTGRKHLCHNLQAVGVTRDGGMAENCIVPAANSYLLPDVLSSVQGALVEPLGCCIHGIQRLNISPGSSALVIGGGFIGLIMVQLLKLSGATEVVLSEPNTAKHGVATDLGVDEVVVPADVPKRLPHGADIVVECVGRRESMQDAVNAASKGGQVLLFGVADPSVSISLRPFEVFSKELAIYGSFINPDTHLAGLELLKTKKVEVSGLVSHEFELADVADVMRSYEALNVTKGIIRC